MNNKEVKESQDWIFVYNTDLSFGPGAWHYSIRKISENLFLISSEGTPQQPSKGRKVQLSKEEEAEIRDCDWNRENAQYLRHSYLKRK